MLSRYVADRLVQNTNRRLGPFVGQCVTSRCGEEGLGIGSWGPVLEVVELGATR